MLEPRIADALGAAFIQARDADGPVAARLTIYAEALRRHFPEYDSKLRRLVERLDHAAAGTTAPGMGDAMPPFLLPDQDGRLVSLAETHANGPAAIVLLRGHWCPFCRLYMKALVLAHPRITALGGTMVAISPETQHFTQRQVVEAAAPFPVLSDIANGYALALNLAVWVGDEMQDILKRINRDLSQYHGNNGWMLPIPAAFVIDRDGRVTDRFVDPDFRNRMDIDEVVAAVARAATHR